MHAFVFKVEVEWRIGMLAAVEWAQPRTAYEEVAKGGCVGEQQGRRGAGGGERRGQGITGPSQSHALKHVK